MPARSLTGQATSIPWVTTAAAAAEVSDFASGRAARRRREGVPGLCLVPYKGGGFVRLITSPRTRPSACRRANFPD
ncbi:protein of unknown function [Candidatus Methylocalor cossyra]|uniref:Secreted protein n=1 Tax=Candidatus Methylocalor cossyra TaxID=3108543 RepID=A0ABM9NIX6_9GAMM